MQHLCLTLPFFFFGKSVPGNWSQWIHVTVYTQRPQRPSAREDNPSRVSQELSPREAQLLRRVIWSCPQPCLLTATTHRAVAGCACVGHESSPVSAVGEGWQGRKTTCSTVLPSQAPSLRAYLTFAYQ